MLYQESLNRGEALRVNSSPYNGSAVQCPICEGWFNKKAHAQLTKEQCENMSKAEILNELGRQANELREKVNKERREKREKAKSTYKRRKEERLATDARIRERAQRRRERIIDDAFERCGKYGIDLSIASYEDVDKKLTEIINKYELRSEYKNKRSAEKALEAAELYFCEIDVDETACDALDD